DGLHRRGDDPERIGHRVEAERDAQPAVEALLVAAARVDHVSVGRDDDILPAPQSADADVDCGTADGAARAVVAEVQADQVAAVRGPGGGGGGDHRRRGAPGLQVALQLVLLPDHTLQVPGCA